MNEKNRRHVQKIWGKEGRKLIHIPLLVDNYNHWMLGIDLVDQRIAYYHPDLRCRRNWIPMFIQLMSLIRNNSYVVYESHKKKPMSQKAFLLDMITFLRVKAYVCDTKETFRRAPAKKRKHCEEAEELASIAAKTQNKTKRLRIEDCPQRFCTSVKHIHATVGLRAPCIVCATLFEDKMVKYSKAMETARWKLKKPDWQKEVTRTHLGCVGCSTKGHPCFLCKSHFTQFHDS